MKRLRLLVALVVLVLAPGLAHAAADTCTLAATSGSGSWSAIGTFSGITASCTGGDNNTTVDNADTVVIPAGVHVTTTGNITFATGAINITGGTLVHSGGTTISWTGATATGIVITDGAYIPQGQVIWEGRIGSAITYDATTASFTLPVADISSIATTSDFVQFVDDDPADVEATIKTPVQIGGGPPIPGYYRPSYRKWAWHKIETAPASATLSIYTNDFSDAESLAPADDAYDGTRGPLLVSDTAITGAPTRVVSDNGITSLIVYGNTGAVADGDLALQYVEFTSGACSDVDGTGKDRNEMFKIAWTDVDGGGAGVDHVYVWGDATGCGSGVNTLIHYGIREGDPIRIVRPAILAGADGVAGPSVLWYGGRVQADFARFVYLDDTNTIGGQTLPGNCVFCVARISGSTVDADDSWITNSQFAYSQMASSDTGVVGFYAHNSGQTAYLDTAPLEMRGFTFDRNYIADQAFNDPDSTPNDRNGNHGVHVFGANNLVLTRGRVERIGDDGLALFQNDFDAEDNPTTTTVRSFVIGEIWDTTEEPNSAQCVEIGSTNTASDVDATLHTFKVSDVFAHGCADGQFSAQTLGGRYDRIVASSAPTTNGYGIGSLSNFTNLPVAQINAQPNITKNSILSLYGEQATAGVAQIGGDLIDSIVIGNQGTTGRELRNVRKLSGVFANFNTSASATLRRATGAVAFRVPTVTLENTAIINNSSNSAANRLCRDFNHGSYFSALALNRVFLGFERVSTAGFLLNTDCVTGTDTTQPVTIDGLTLSVTTQTTGGIGNGTADDGTAEGARIANACTESTSTRTSTNAFGADVTDTSFVVGDSAPNPGDDATIGAFVARRGSVSVCGSAALPERLGLSEFGVAHAMLGDGLVRNIELVTTDERLIRAIGGGGGRGGPNIR